MTRLEGCPRALEETFGFPARTCPRKSECHTVGGDMRCLPRLKCLQATQSLLLQSLMHASTLQS